MAASLAANGKRHGTADGRIGGTVKGHNTETVAN
jgi:hypothetical protein